ncbi:hypothetical protein [Rhizobium sp. P28RR-XV]|uniref:hypothetical protein n=1 Tax=Rhizobium sp. P28RR-XV TaxID=2726737 RepID=UPI001456F231|nr:hypothetical protein [Rhizobium sp. P28RR-XV]NLR86303.1 hypothetical protein [Rhizobium sp. P28RR-XV]
MNCAYPAAPEGYLNLSNTLAKSKLAEPTHERIALVVAQIKGTTIAFQPITTSARTLPSSTKPKTLPTQMVLRTIPAPIRRGALPLRWHASAAMSRTSLHRRGAGYSDGEIIEILLHVALNLDELSQRNRQDQY